MHFNNKGVITKIHQCLILRITPIFKQVIIKEKNIACAIYSKYGFYKTKQNKKRIHEIA